MLLFFIGAAFGIIGGMGLGGGIVLVPVLTGVMSFTQHQAQALCLLCFVPASVCAVIMHFYKKNIDIKKAISMSFLGVLGAALGAVLANISQGEILKLIFGIFMLVLGGIRVSAFVLKKSRRQKHF